MRVRATVYVESTIPSYLAARPSRDLIVAGHQQITHEWWDRIRPGFDVYISQVVLDEVSAGDPAAAARRLALLDGLPLLDVTEEVMALAGDYQSQLALPVSARLDVLHLSCAAVHEIDYLLTWNCTHLANGRVIRRLQGANRESGRHTPVILTPEELMVMEAARGE